MSEPDQSSPPQAPTPTMAPSAKLEHDPFPRELHPRLSIVTPLRVTMGTVVSGFIGFSLGATKGGQTAQLRFRAEHAHKMPDSTAGWYLYHKSKNYHAMQGGIREGLKMGARTSFWSFMALSLESTVDRCRGASDMFSTVVASLTVAGAFSLLRKYYSTSWLSFRLTIQIDSPSRPPRELPNQVCYLVSRTEVCRMYLALLGAGQ